MLDDKEITRIRAEEIFRQEVRREIAAGAPKRTKREQLWSVLNSSFALWFLSSVVVTSLTAGIAMYQKNHSQQRQKMELQRRLNTEIAARIEEGLVALRLDIKRIESGKAFFPSHIYLEALSYLDNRVISRSVGKLDFSIYSEYQQRSFRSLIFELSTIIEETNRPALREADADFKRLVDLADQASIMDSRSNLSAFDKSVTLEAVKKSIEILTRLQIIPFWHVHL